MKEQPRTIYRSMQGKEIDINTLISRNEMTVAVGNVKVNARGDELGPGGQVIRKTPPFVAKSTIPNQSNSRPNNKRVTEKKSVVETSPISASTRRRTQAPAEGTEV